jgi:DNA-binding GntR family transcriptional regulator
VDRFLARPGVKDLPRHVREVYRTLLELCASRDGILQVKVSDEQLSERAGYSSTHLKAARRELRARGLVEVVPGTGHRRSRYVIAVPR